MSVFRSFWSDCSCECQNVVSTKLTASTETLKLRADSRTDFEIMAVLPGESKNPLPLLFCKSHSSEFNGIWVV